MSTKQISIRRATWLLVLLGVVNTPLGVILAASIGTGLHLHHVHPSLAKATVLAVICVVIGICGIIGLGIGDYKIVRRLMRNVR